MSQVSKTIPAIDLTAQQHVVFNDIHDPYVKASNKEGAVSVYEIRDDNHVALYTIQPNGEYIVEALLDGFNYGWTTLDSQGYVIDSDGDRLSDAPHPEWVS